MNRSVEQVTCEIYGLQIESEREKMGAIKNIAYKAVDVMTLGRGIKRNFSGEEIRFPPKWSRYFRTDYEPETFAFFSEHLSPGDTVMDIGAHIGLFSVIAARLVGESGKVFSFEPTPFTRKVLSQMVRLNHCENIVSIRGEAVSDKRGKTTFFDTGDTISVMNSLIKNERSQGGFEVLTITVDEFVSEHHVRPTCLKVDVEGAELALLKGALKTMKDIKPTMRFSLHPPFIPNAQVALDEIWSIFKENQYSIKFNGAEVEKDWFCSRVVLFDVDVVPTA